MSTSLPTIKNIAKQGDPDCRISYHMVGAIYMLDFVISQKDSH
jgi:hypothetical protein